MLPNVRNIVRMLVMNVLFLVSVLVCWRYLTTVTTMKMLPTVPSRETMPYSTRKVTCTSGRKISSWSGPELVFSREELFISV